MWHFCSLLIVYCILLIQCIEILKWFGVPFCITNSWLSVVVMRIGKKSKDLESKSQLIEGICRLICTSKTQTNPLTGGNLIRGHALSISYKVRMIFVCFASCSQHWWCGMDGREVLSAVCSVANPHQVLSSPAVWYRLDGGKCLIMWTLRLINTGFFHGWNLTPYTIILCHPLENDVGAADRDWLMVLFVCVVTIACGWCLA